jgi:membrane-bound ClpP family serine protease
VPANRPVTSLVGGLATAQTLIGPTGIAYAAGESWSARSLGPEIRAGEPVRVVDVEGLELIVEPAPADSDDTTEE